TPSGSRIDHHQHGCGRGATADAAAAILIHLLHHPSQPSSGAPAICALAHPLPPIPSPCLPAP
ncbi:hypothetical protein NPS74_23490, partial [Cutibacterium acnes subsp. acnes]|nr:hypothetical protein [Cutibacterium acnes subsp. acnes]